MTTSLLENPSFAYPGLGVYPVEFTVSLPNGQTATVRRKVIIFETITCDFSFDGGDCYAITFTDDSVVSETIDSWLWDFDDGDTSTLQNPVHTYLVAGTYAVTLQIQTTGGGIGTKNYSVDVVDPLVVPDFTSVVTGLDVDFTDTSVPTGATEASWYWDFDDGNTSTSQNPTNVYAVGGTYNVSLTVTDSCGNDWVIAHDAVTVDPIYLPLHLDAGSTTVGAITTNGHVYQTSNFAAGSPTWTNITLSPFSGSIVNVVPDQFSPLYQGTGSTVNCWLFTTAAVYYVTDVFNATPTVTLQYTPSSAPIWRIAAGGVSWQQYTTSGLVAALGRFGTFGTSHLIVSQDNGSTWSNYDLTAYFISAHGVDFGNNNIVSMFMSSESPGDIYLVTLRGTGISPPAGANGAFRLWKSSDYGATFTQYANMDGVVVNALAPDSAVEINDLPDIAFYFAQQGSISPNVSAIWEFDGSSVSQITALPAGYSIGSSSRLHTCASDSDVWVLCAAATGGFGVWYSNDAGATWTGLSSTSFVNIGIDPNNSAAVWAWGVNLLQYRTSGTLATKLSGTSGSVVGVMRGN